MSRMQKSSAIVCSAAMAASLVYAAFELGLGPSQWQIVVGFALAVVFAAAFGYRFGRWYRPVGGERPTFELVLCPVVVYLLASLCGSAVACVLMAASNQPSPRDLVTGVPAMALFGVIFVSIAAWPAILVSHAAAALVLARLSRSASNNSSKPTPLRGTA